VAFGGARLRGRGATLLLELAERDLGGTRLSSAVVDDRRLRSAASARTCAVRSVALVIGTPLNDVTTSPFFRPAAAAAPPEVTSAM
jgi:hypothetical protein